MRFRRRFDWPGSRVVAGQLGVVRPVRVMVNRNVHLRSPASQHRRNSHAQDPTVLTVPADAPLAQRVDTYWIAPPVKPRNASASNVSMNSS